MRTLLAFTVVALSAAPAAVAKFRVRLSVAPSSPHVHVAAQAVLRSATAESGCRMRLLAVAPHVDRFRALDAFINGGYGVNGPSGPVFHRLRPTSRMGFLVSTAQTGPKTWRANIRFPRAGRWQLIVPNWCAPGYAYPPPVARKIVVR